MAYRIALIGGGTGGHVYPLIAVAKKLVESGRQKGISVEIALIGSGRFLQDAAKEAGLPFKSVLSAKKRRYASASNFTDILKLPFGVVQALWHLLWFMPDIAFAKGGHASLLPGLAAKFYMIPLYIHESDSMPGSANLTLSRFAKKIFTAFESANSAFAGKNVELVGNPVRDEILGGDRAKAVEYFKLDTFSKIILVLGGSQGAQIINDAVINSIVPLTENFQVIHQTGQELFKSVSDQIGRVIKEGGAGYGQVVQARHRAYPFLTTNELALAYAAADVVVSRAGANTIAELAALGKPCVIVPIPAPVAANDHQRKNAYEFQKFGAVVVEEENLKATILIDQVNDLLNNPERYAKVSESIKQFAKPEAAVKIAQQLLGQ